MESENTLWDSLEISPNPSPAGNEATTKLPLSYVMWLTLRSKFIDTLAEKDPNILSLWKEFENMELEEMEKLVTKMEA